MNSVPFKNPARAEEGAPAFDQMELGKASALLHLALEAGRSVAWDWNVRSGQDSWSGDLQTIFGIPSTTFVGHVEDFRRRVHPQDRELVWRAVKDAMENRTLYVAEFRVIRLDDSVVWLAAQGKFYYSSNGEPERMLGIAVDITQRKTSEEALRRKDMELAEAQQLARVGTWSWNREGDLSRWSDELYRIMGRDSRLPAVRLWEDSQFFTAESLERLRQAVEETERSGAQYELDLEVIRPDGSTRWIAARGEIQRDPAGKTAGLRGTLQDITERRRFEEALREREERLRLAAQAGRMYAFEWDPRTDVIVRSAEFSHLLGISGETRATRCQQIMNLVHPDDQAKVMAATGACSSENSTYQVQYRVLRPDGSIVWLEKTGHGFFDRNGELQKVIGMVVDITERKRAEEALSTLGRKLIGAQEAERARIARNLHDDVGQRFAVILATLDQLKQDCGPFMESTGSQEGDRKGSTGSRFDELRRQITDVSRSITDLSHELHSASLRHLGMAKAMRGFCRELSEKQQVEIAFSDNDLPSLVTQETALCLFRILQESLHNAVKYSQTRRFAVDVRGASNAILLTVRDSGVGFDPEEAMNGHGLGLISMQERLKLVNGELNIESRRGSGTAIHARVPLSLAG